MNYRRVSDLEALCSVKRARISRRIDLPNRVLYALLPIFLSASAD
jgi:hypothetical protein